MFTQVKRTGQFITVLTGETFPNIESAAGPFQNSDWGISSNEDTQSFTLRGQSFIFNFLASELIDSNGSLVGNFEACTTYLTEVLNFKVGGGGVTYDSKIIVKSASDLQNIDSSKVYELDGIIDFTGTGLNIEVPAGGANIIGSTFNVSKIICADLNYTLFTSPVGGSGDLLFEKLAIEVTGSNSQVFDLVSASGFDAFEFSTVNFNNCSSLGEVSNYRQGLEFGTGRFGGAPNLTMSGAWNGYRINTSIVRVLSNTMTGALFQTGAGFTMSGRFLCDMNCDLPTNAIPANNTSFTDFSASNFPNPDTLLLKGMRLSRDAVVDPMDANLIPNIDEAALASNWKENVGIPNTIVGATQTITTEASTSLVDLNTYYLLNGAYTTSNLQHFDSFDNGFLRYLGNESKTIQLSGEYVIDGSPNDVLTLRVVVFRDSDSSTEEITKVRRVINNIVGGRDVAFFPLNGKRLTFNQNDYIYIEIKNESSAGTTATAELDSEITLTEI